MRLYKKMLERLSPNNPVAVLEQEEPYVDAPEDKPNDDWWEDPELGLCHCGPDEDE